jgi:hypothetical protein
VLHNIGQNFDVHGIVKPGANTESIVNTSTKLTGKLTKKGHSGFVGRHTGCRDK